MQSTLRVALLFALAGIVWGATFGTPVVVGGHASDIALDEARGFLYVANYTANRIEVMSLADGAIQRSINVNQQPGALALSPDGRYLVVTHFAPAAAPAASGNAVTVINLADNKRQTFGLGQPPLGVAFGADGLALLVTTTDFLLFEPASGWTQQLGAISDVVAKDLPVDPATFPPQIIAASVTASGDGLRMYGVIDSFKSNDSSTTGVLFSYGVLNRRLVAIRFMASPALGPRVVSVNRDGSSYIAGWGLFGCDFRMHGDCDASGPLVAEFPDTTGKLNIGSHVIDSGTGLIYAQVQQVSGTSSTTAQRPVLMVLDADNLNVRERIQLPENLAGRAVLDSAGKFMYAVSDSGVLILPVGLLNRAPRLAASSEDLVFRSNSCDRTAISQQVAITDVSGGHVPFTLVSSMRGVDISPATGTTPAMVTVRVDPAAFQNQKGTVVASIELRSGGTINVPQPIRVLINTHDPDQRGTFVNIAGKLVDLLADPRRSRVYVLRQDRNQVIVLDSTTYNQLATLRTSNTPTQMAITFDGRYLLVGHNDSQLAYVYDLETLEAAPPIRFPMGHYPRSLAVAGDTILAATRVAGPEHKIDRVDFANRTATELSSLGIYKNNIHVQTVLQGTPNGSWILVAMPDGNVMLYDARAGTFTVSRKDTSALSGAYAASSYGTFVVGDRLLNASLVPVQQLDIADGSSSGFAFTDNYGLFTTASRVGAGMIRRVNLVSGMPILATRTAEAPLISSAAFTRTLAPLPDRQAIVALTTSGLMILPWDYDAALAPPRLDRVVNAADYSRALAPGSLVSIFGQDLSPVNLATRQMPLPTALGESCLTVNGMPVPLVFVSSTQINAQLPYSAEGQVTLTLRTPGGVSDNLNLLVASTAPGIFRSGTAGPDTGIPTVIRAKNNALVTPSNPIHLDEQIVVYLTGLGKTAPAVDDGVPAPAEPLAAALIQPTVTLGGVNLPVLYAGLVPGQVGVYQINVRVLFRGIPTGFDIPLTITQGGASTTIPVRVVN